MVWVSGFGDYFDLRVLFLALPRLALRDFDFRFAWLV